VAGECVQFRPVGEHGRERLDRLGLVRVVQHYEYSFARHRTPVQPSLASRSTRIALSVCTWLARSQSAYAGYWSK
jgi:hypothetical protein